MADDPDPPRPQRKPTGNSAEALRALLERHGLHTLLEEVDRHRGLTLFGACCEAGLRKRPEPTGNGSPNMAKTRAFYFNKALMAAQSEPHKSVPIGTLKTAPTPRVTPAHRSAPGAMPDLAAALAEVGEMHAHPVARIPR